MSGLAFTLVKIGFLVVLWIFVAIIAAIVRTDVFGRGVPGTEGASQPNPKRRGRAQAGQARLVVIAGTGVGDAVPLTGEITLGRAGDCTLDINDDYASSHHARLYRDDQSWILADLGSTNGTYINGVRIVRATRIGPGDLIRIGRTQLQMEG